MPATLDSNYRFLLSHELGHILLHEFKSHSSDRTTLCKMEHQANVFALSFLMPENSFKTALKTHDIYELAEIYGVTIQAVKNRFKLIKNSTDWRSS
ncbi:ImmA/IrrE family metallo-endopeptidase [Eubacteriaceae bacterium ES2]|nr:ImmA/IrrE family metallo-endopeptidase [Eubacteriaceae bacterium ES2]